MGIVYDDEQPATPTAPAAPVIKYDEEPSPSAALFERGAPPLAGLSGLIAPGAPTPPDKYEQAAIAERDRLLKAGVPLPEGYTSRLASGPLLGWGDEIMAGATTPLEMIKHGTIDPREGYKYGRARERLSSDAARENTGYTGDALNVVGGLATLPGNIFGRQAAAALGGGGTGVLPAIARMAGYGAEAGTLGAVQGAGSARTVEDTPHDALTGGAAAAALGAPFGAFANVARRSTAAVPTEAELNRLGARDYKARDRLPVSFDLEQVGQRLADVGNATRGKYGRDTPFTVAALRDRAEEAAADVARARALNPNPPNQVAAGPGGAPNQWQAVATPRDIASLRREIYDEGARGTPTDERAGAIASKLIDRIATRPDPAMLASGVNPRDAATAAMLNQRGRGNFAAGYRSQAVTEAVDKSLEQAAGQHSGLNFENIIRQNLRQAKAKDAFGGFNAAEEAGADRLIAGTAKANQLRELGNMLGGGGGLGRMAAMGGGGAGGGALASYYYGGDPWMGAAGGLALGLTGRGIRTYANRKALADTQAFASVLRQRSPEYQARLAVAPTEIGPGLPGPISRGARNVLMTGNEGSIRDAIARSLLSLTGERDDKEKQ
jgi:hypothetical protein